MYITSSDIETKTVTYGENNSEIVAISSDKKITMQDVMTGQASLDDLVGQMTIPEMAELCVGTSRGQMGGDTAIIGNASAVVPGAAGDTTSLMIEDRDIRNMVLADGPAGLRLSRIFKADADGNVIPGTSDAPIPGMDLLMKEHQSQRFQKVQLIIISIVQPFRLPHCLRRHGTWMQSENVEILSGKRWKNSV